MKPREITIRIDTLVIDGVSANDPRGLRASLSAEIERLLAERGVPPQLLAGRAAVRTPSMRLAPGSSESLGQRAAQALYQSLQSAAGGGEAKRSPGGQS